MRSVILFFYLGLVQAITRPLVTTQLGALRGIWLTSENGHRYAAFMTVPYAKPPIGVLRFEPPQPIDPWEGEWDAGQPSPLCMAFAHRLSPHDYKQIKGQEDCLYLNVYTPKLPKDSEEKLDMPVIIFIHGGAFMFSGGALYGAKFMMDREVVLVTINYRVGPLGFLSLGDDVQPGNNGMRDQVEAFRWVNKHISKFGGDPNSVTLIGQSAGGASVHFHYLSPLSRGLFQRGVSVSGTALCRWALADKAKEKGLQLAASVGCPTDKGSRILLNCLKSRPAHHILLQVSQFQVWYYSPFSPFAPVIERPDQENPAPFLIEDPITAISRGAMLNASWITGVTTAEGLYPAASFVGREDELARLEHEFEYLVPHILDFNLTVEPGHQAEVARLIRSEYFGERPVSKSTVPEVIKMISDRLFVVDGQRAAQLQALHAPVFFYIFDFRGKQSLSDIMTDTTRNFGVSHSDETIYFINVTYISAHNVRNQMEKRMETLMLDLWTSFARNGIPEATDAPIWEPLNPGQDIKYLYIGGVPPEMAQATDLGNTAFWESLPFFEDAQNYARINDTLRNIS